MRPALARLVVTGLVAACLCGCPRAKTPEAEWPADREGERIDEAEGALERATPDDRQEPESLFPAEQEEDPMTEPTEEMDLNDGAETDPVFNDDAGDEDAERDDPDFGKKAIAAKASTATNLFEEARAEEKAKELQRLHDRQVGLLIGGKNLERLRAFGFDVVSKGEALPPLSSHQGATT